MGRESSSISANPSSRNRSFPLRASTTTFRNCSLGGSLRHDRGAGHLAGRDMKKKLIEVALPLEKINKAAAKEKSIRHGHPSTLHLWWARRPLAACRAVLFASLVDDPDSDPAYLRPDGKVDEERAAGKRAQLFDLIEELVLWENSNNPRVINKARAEIARCVASRKIE